MRTLTFIFLTGLSGAFCQTTPRSVTLDSRSGAIAYSLWFEAKRGREHEYNDPLLLPVGSHLRIRQLVQTKLVVQRRIRIRKVAAAEGQFS
jgi:hypothetical protein